VLTTDQKGNIAEVAIALAAIKLGIDVYWPVGEGAVTSSFSTFAGG
jgi:hypothetical protein